jgi:4,5-dihydroxyphthalate decarboxylase
MLRDMAYDLCSMPIVNFLSAREHGLQVSALPIFPTRRLLHRMLICDRRQVRTPGDLEGKRIGIGYYGNTDSTWVRGLLADYGVDLRRITWVTSSEEQVPGVTLPPNVEHYEAGAKLGQYTGVPGAELDSLLIAGEIAGVIYGRGELVYESGVLDLGASDLGPIFDDVPAADLRWLRSKGFFPMMTVIVARDSVLARWPDLSAVMLYQFTAAKQRALARVSAYTAEDTNLARICGLADAIGDGPIAAALRPDPLPYGVEPNRQALATIVRYAFEQGVIEAMPSVDELFVPRS